MIRWINSKVCRTTTTKESSLFFFHFHYSFLVQKEDFQEWFKPQKSMTYVCHSLGLWTIKSDTHVTLSTVCTAEHLILSCSTEKDFSSKSDILFCLLTISDFVTSTNYIHISQHLLLTQDKHPKHHLQSSSTKSGIYFP